MDSYINLRLTLNKLDKGRYRARLEHEAKASPQPVEFNFAPQEKISDGKTFQDYFDDINDLKAKIVSDDLRIVGGALYQRVFKGELNGTFQAWLEEMRDNNRKCRLRLDIDAPELVDIPWELLYSDAGNWFLARREISIVRYMYSASRNEVVLSPALKVLIVSAAPEDMHFEEQKYIEPLKSFFESYNIIPKLLTGSEANYHNLREELNKPYDVFHFMGHGVYRGNIGKIFLVGADGRSEELESGDLGTFLGKSKVKLAFLCSCQTSRITPPTPVEPDHIKSPFRGVAQNLVGAGVPAVVAMQYNFPETEDNKTFVNTFYKKLLESNSIDEAMQEARLAIRGSKVAWCIPTLYSQFNVGKLVEPIAPPTPSPLRTISSDEKSEVQKIISKSTKLDARERRRNFLQECGLRELLGELNLEGNTADFASSILNNLTEEQLRLFLSHLLNVDPFLSSQEKELIRLLLHD